MTHSFSLNAFSVKYALKMFKLMNNPSANS